MATHEVIYRLKVDGNPADELEATARAAEAAARAEEHVAEASKQAAIAAEHQAREVAHAGERLEDTAGRVGGAFNKLAGAASMVSPELGGMIRNFGDIADIGEVVGSSMSGLGVSLAATGVALGAVTAAGMVAYGMWEIYSHKAEVAREQQDLLNTAIRDGEEASARLADLDLELQGLTGAKTAAEIKYERSVRETQRALDERTDKAIEAAKAETAGFAVTKETLASIMTDLAANPQHFNELDNATKKLVTTVGLARTEQEQTLSLLGQVRDAELKDKDAKQAKTAVIKEQTAAVKQLADAYQTIMAGGTTYTYGPGGGQVTTRGQLTGNQVGQLASANQDAAMLGGPLMTDKAIQAQLDAVDAVDHWNTALTESTDTMSKAQAAMSKGTSIIGGVAGGPSSMFAAMGPWGALVDAIVKAVTHIADIGDSFTQYTVDINEAIGSLPDTIMSNLPKWIEDGTRASMAMVPKLIGSLISAFFDPQNWIDMAEAFVKGFSDGLTEGFSDWKAPSTSSGGSFDLFGALGGGAGTSGTSSKSPDLVVKASDWWSDFTKSVDRETQQLGRAFA